MKINTHVYNALTHMWCMSRCGDCAKTNTYVARTQPPRKYIDTYIMKNRGKCYQCISTHFNEYNKA